MFMQETSLATPEVGSGLGVGRMGSIGLRGGRRTEILLMSPFLCMGWVGRERDDVEAC
jgi:hypothetical protein